VPGPHSPDMVICRIRSIASSVTLAFRPPLSPLGRSMTSLLALLVAAGGVRRGDRVLDIGCGPGYFARTIPERGVWRLVASLTGRTAMRRRVSPLEPLAAEVGSTDLRSGDAPPWLHYVRAAKP